MPSVTLLDLYVVELTDLYDAEHQILRELPLMAAGVTSETLREAFDAHYRQTQQQVEHLERLFDRLDERPRPHQARALLTIIEDSRTRYSVLERGDVRDAAVIAAARRIEHYEMAAYGCARAYAATLGDHAAAEILNQILQEEREMDQRLMALAEKGIAENATTPIPAVWVTDATGLFPTPKTWPE